MLGGAQQPGAGLEPPNKILFVQGLPPATNDSMLGMLFQQFPGAPPVTVPTHPFLPPSAVTITPNLQHSARVHSRQAIPSAAPLVLRGQARHSQAQR